MRNQLLAERLLAAWRGGALLDAPPDELVPRDWTEAREIQDYLMQFLGPVGGYKVGSAGPNGAISLAPLPAAGITASGTTLIGWHQRWVEAEIAVKLAHDLPAREAPYSDAEVLAAIGTVHPVIEVLNSRFRDPGKVDALSLAADLIMHGGLIVGRATAMPDLAAETVSVLIDGAEASRGQGHPAGDLPRLLRYLADHPVGLRAGQIITTGSWNPVTIPGENSEVTVRFAHAGEATVKFSGQ